MEIFGKQNQEQSGDEQRLAAWIKSKIEEVRMSGPRVSHEGTWMTNSAYLLGFSGVNYDTQARQFRMLGHGGTPLKRSRMAVNKILPNAQLRVAKLCQSPPKYDVRPGSSDQEDKDSARLSLQVLNMIMDKENVETKRINLYMYLQQCGHSYVKVYWDPTKGKKIKNPVDGQEIPEGDVCIDVVSAFEIFPDPVAKTIEECQWLVQAKVRKLEYFKEQYPKKGHLVKEEQAWLLSTQYEQRINTLNTMGPTSSGIGAQMKGAAIEMAYYEKPSEKHPKGRTVIAANGILLEDKELSCGEINFVKFDDVVIGGKFYSEAIITHARPIQDQYNRLISKRAEWTNMLLSGKYLAPRGSGLIQESLNDQNGEVIEYDAIPGQPPVQPLAVPMIPQYAYEEENRLNSMFNEIFGLNEISKGQLPPSGFPAIGMQLLQDADSSRMSVVTSQHELAWAKVGQLVLKYVNEYYKTPRLLKISGKNQEYIVKEFQAADLRNSYDVIVIRGSTVPTSKSTRRNDIMNAFQSGLLGDPADPKLREKVLGMMEYGDVAELWEDFSIDESQIKKDLDKIEKEEVPEVHELDNHEMHIMLKNRYRKTDKFYQLSDIGRQILLDNIEGHIEALMMRASPQMAAAQKVGMEGEQVRESLMNNPEIVEEETTNPEEPIVPPQGV